MWHREQRASTGEDLLLWEHTFTESVREDSNILEAVTHELSIITYKKTVQHHDRSKQQILKPICRSTYNYFDFFEDKHIFCVNL